LLAYIEETEARAIATRAAIAQKAFTIAINNNLSKNNPFIIKITLAAHVRIAAKLV
jgi:hypothetical protein